MEKIKIYFDVNDDGVKPYKIENGDIVLSEIPFDSDGQNISAGVLLPYKGQEILMVYCDNSINTVVHVVQGVLKEVYEEDGGFIISSEEILEDFEIEGELS